MSVMVSAVASHRPTIVQCMFYLRRHLGLFESKLSINNALKQFYVTSYLYFRIENVFRWHLFY